MQSQMNKLKPLKCILLSALLFYFAVSVTAQNDTISRQNQEMQTFDSYKDVGYNQVIRPQFHFTSLKNWINDPNGMVWYDGEYHLFFQHNPLDAKWGNMTWGHAISADMIHWKQLPHAILPYSGGTIFSGTAVVDYNNILDKQKGNTKTLVAIFTFAREPFFQAGVFSTDKGRTFQLINNGAALVPNQGLDKGERDPKVFWHEPSKKWILVLWVKLAENTGKSSATPGKIRFFTSNNLIDWKATSDFDREWVFECVDFVELAVDGNKNNKKWLLYDASFDYEIGDFDGKVFTTDKKVFKGDVGINFYAAQTFNNSPDGRTVMIGWMSDGANSFLKANMPFNQQMSFPTTMTLKTTTDGVRLFRWPVKEIEQLYVKTYSFKNLSAKKAIKKLTDIKAELLDMSIEFAPTESMKLNIRGLELTYDHKNELFIFGASKIPAPIINGKVKLRVLVDRASLELFVNEGAAVASFCAEPPPDHQKISFSANDEMKINSLVINVLKSSWVNSK